MITIPLSPLYVWFLVFLRSGFVLAFFPLVGERFVPLRVRVILAAAIAAALAPVAPFGPEAFPHDMAGLVSLIACEALLGFGIGLIGRILFAIVQFSGQVAGEQMGFGLINAIDPTGSHQISVIAELQYLLAILIFLSTDLHHTFLIVLTQSFTALPPGGATLTPGVADFMMRLGSILFSLSLRFAMPVIVIIFAINVALGLIARAVPQVNVFLESFPLRIIAGVSVMMVSLGITVALWQNMFGDLQAMMTTLVRLMAG
jgi:flagellar biosynthetic protein FliR